MKVLGLIFCLISIILVVFFFKMSAAINRMRVSAKLTDNERASFYKKVTALVLIGIATAACSAASVICMLQG